jgi:hypothetical protein
MFPGGRIKLGDRIRNLMWSKNCSKNMDTEMLHKRGKIDKGWKSRDFILLLFVSRILKLKLTSNFQN